MSVTTPYTIPLTYPTAKWPIFLNTIYTTQQSDFNIARVKSIKIFKRGLLSQINRRRLNPVSVPSSPVPMGSPIINTSFRHRATVWRLKSRAAAAEQALHTAALLKRKSTPIQTPTTHLSQANSGASTPITGLETATVNSTPYTTVAVAGSEDDDSIGSQDTGNINPRQSTDLVEENDQDENFEDIEDSIQQIQLQSEEAFRDAQRLWPDVFIVEMQYGILNEGIHDMKLRLASGDAPNGHDLTWHLQVLQFMNWQMRCLKTRQLLGSSFRKECAMNVDIGFGKGARVRDRLLENEKRWVKERDIERSKQGRTSSMVSMLEDEGIMIAVREFIASSGGGIRAETLCNAVSEYWQSQMTSVDRQQEIGLLSSSLQELDTACATFTTAHDKLTIHANTAQKWLKQLGYSWREVKKGVYKDAHEREGVDHIVQQTLLAVNIFEAAYPGCQALFLFDNATSHSAFAEDALRVTRMNKGPGGEPVHVRDGYWFKDNGERVVQAMDYDKEDMSVPVNLRGEPKGLQQEDTNRRKNRAPETRLLFQNATLSTTLFLQQKGRVQEVVEAKGHMILFYPRFHCELNWIEYFWARVKLYTRTHCGYDIKSLRKNVPLALEDASPLIPKWWGKSLRIMDVYRNGTVYGTEEFKVKAYKSHRRISAKDSILF
ncbi:hypothetical protein DFP73DRAFT_598397 [Morchella snyderi]|nr:hypothetical protein DFP73DRAFT_598397 [Morchella snyderi]